MDRVKNTHVKIVIFIMILCIAGGGLFWYLKTQNAYLHTPIKVGILHAQTGTMAISEKAVIDATLMAIHELNEAGGVLGKQIEPIVVDTQSNWEYSAQMAKKLITEDKVSVVFGCWTSACRKTVKPIFEKYNHLLFYPVQYEGLEPVFTISKACLTRA